MARIRALDRSFGERWIRGAADREPSLELRDGSRIAVVGGGPAGSFFSFFVQKMAEVLDLELAVDVYEPRSFDRCGPAGCNHCGGIVSESLVQLLATEGITLPQTVVQRGIESYVLHMDVGSVRIETPLHEKRIAAVFRGNGPRDAVTQEWRSFDRFLLDLGVERGARVVRRLVTGVDWPDGRPALRHADGPGEAYDLLVLATGVNTKLLESVADTTPAFRRPDTVPTFICEFELGHETVQRCFGPSMHVFMLDMPRLEFAALVPKGSVVTLCMLGEDIDDDLVRSFLSLPEVRGLFPAELASLDAVCSCAPRINLRGAPRPYGDRFVVVGDSGVTRLFKDGIGAAYRTAKAAAATAVFQGVSGEAFHDHFAPVCRRIAVDNRIGALVFAVNDQLKRRKVFRRAIHTMVSKEQSTPERTPHMSGVLWDLFTGSAPYREVLRNTLRPGFVAGIAGHTARSVVTGLSGATVEGGVHVDKRAG